MNGLVKIVVVIFGYCHDGICILKRVLEKEFLVVHDELVVTQATVGLRHGDTLEELVALLVLGNNLHREVAGTDTDSLDGDNDILLNRHLTTTVAVVVGINIVFLRTCQHLLVYQQFTSLIDIAQISQRRHTLAAVAVVFE